MNKKFWGILFFVYFLVVAQAFGFVVRNIQVNGLSGISKETVLSYLPVKVGQSWSADQSSQAIRALYASGLFEDVSLDARGDTLIINVVERNIISNVLVIGNETISKEQVDNALRELGLIKGRVFKPVSLAQVKQLLESEYARLGKENATVTATVKQKDHHRVAIDIIVNEGKDPRIASITFIGNKAFSSSKLMRQISMSDSYFWSFSFFTHKNNYSKEKLAQASEALRQFYLNHGYVRFRVDDAQADLTSDKKKVAVVFKLTEGARYRVQGYRFNGNTILSREQLDKLVQITPGKYYSQEEVQKSVEAMGMAIGDQGYGYANITTEPVIDEATKRVIVNFNFDPGPKLYVRNIQFTGNYRTADVVLRRAVRQEEGSVLSVSKVKESERQLRVMNYFENVTVKTHPVPGTNNQVDLDFNVSEMPGAEAILAVGYGTDGAVLNLALNQANFLGTGRTVGIAFKKSEVVENYEFNYFNPYHTEDGIGLAIDLYYRETTPRRVNIARYATDQYGGNVNYLYPLDDRNKFRFGYGYSYLNIKDLGSRPSEQILGFVEENGDTFREVRLNAAWVYNNYDRLPFPTEGLRQELSLNLYLPADSNSLTYYKSLYETHWYYPLVDGFIFNTRGGIGFANGLGSTEDYPFFDNFYAGGLVEPGMVRGYENYSLGPRDSKNDPLGGNFLVHGSAGIIFPNGISRDKLRTQLFIDAGNVYNEDATRFPGTDAGPVRFSTGLGIDWYSPLGPIVFSIATPLNKQNGDSIRYFDFTIAIPL